MLQANTRLKEANAKLLARVKDLRARNATLSKKLKAQEMKDRVHEWEDKCYQILNARWFSAKWLLIETYQMIIDFSHECTTDFARAKYTNAA